MKAKADSLIPALRDLYLTVGNETISLPELESFLKSTKSPHKVLTWMILYLLGQLSAFPIDVQTGNGWYDDERAFARRMWEIISKHCYLNYYKIVCESESVRIKNRFQRPWLQKPQFCDNGAKINKAILCLRREDA